MKHNSPASDVVVSETVITKNEQTCRVLIGDCIESMRLMQDQSVHCCVTSPPYFQLRDYGVDGQIGLEQTPELGDAAAPPKNELRLLKFELEARKAQNEKTPAATNS